MPGIFYFNKKTFNFWVNYVNWKSKAAERIIIFYKRKYNFNGGIAKLRIPEADHTQIIFLLHNKIFTKNSSS
jgi:hypothetical protein